MTIGELAKQVAFFLHQSRNAFVDEDGNDMIIAALNHVRKDAERDWWFSNQQAEAWLSVSPTSGGSLSSGKLILAGAFTETTCNIKAVETVYVGDDVNLSSYYPVYHDSKRLRSIKVRERLGYNSIQSDTIDIPRAPGDYVGRSALHQYQAIFLNNTLQFVPAFTTTKKVAVDCQLWLDDYEADRVIVSTSSTASTSVTLAAAAPLSMVVGTSFMGTTVSAINTARTTITLTANANATITSWTYKPFKNVFGVSSIGNGGENYEDWFTEHGADYLLWGAVVHLNLFTNTFVNRAEGFNAPPEKARDSALAKLKSWDRLMWEQGRVAMRNR